VFASASADKSIRIWDTRKGKTPTESVVGHTEDVNVISWSRVKNCDFLLASGSDDKSFKVWDLRNFKTSEVYTQIQYHSGPITSIEWHPIDESIIAVSSADHSVGIYDFSLERDEGARGKGAVVDQKDIPDSLYFLHCGQTDVKEVHWHRQIQHLCLATSADGISVFSPANMFDVTSNNTDDTVM